MYMINLILFISIALSLYQYLDFQSKETFLFSFSAVEGGHTDDEHPETSKVNPTANN